MASETPSPSEIILERLHQLVQRHSTSAEISRQLEQQDNWLAKFFNRELRFELGRVEMVLEVLDLPLRWFLNWCFEDYPESKPHRVLTLFCPEASSPPDPFLDDLRPKLALRLAQLGSGGLQSDLQAMPESIAAIEQLRFSDRAEAKSKIEAHLLESMVAADPLPATWAAELASALAVWAAIQRTRDHQADAGHAAALALQISQRFQLDATMALLLQRSHYLLRDWGEPRQALHFIERALVQFACLGCQHDVGKCLVDRGRLFRSWQDHHEAIRCCIKAQNLLPASDWRNRAATYQYVAESRLGLGEFDSALEAIDSALALFTDQRVDVCLGHAHWTKARILLQLEEPLKAEDQLRESFDHLVSGGAMPVDIALVALDMAKLLMRQGNLPGVRKLARQVQKISPVLRTSPIVDSVLMEFVRVARFGKVTTLFLAESRKTLESAAPMSRRLRSR